MDVNTAHPIAPRVMAELRGAGVERGRPLIAVDADEVLIDLAAHLGRHWAGRGYRLELTEYRIDGAVTEIATGRVLDGAEIGDLFEAFFREETWRQAAIPGAALALASLARDAQIVILTNAPAFARAHRMENLRGHGMPYPVVANEGGKGRPLRWLAAQADAPTAFVDDTPAQIESVARHAPEVRRIHLVGSADLRRLIGHVAAAHHRPTDWDQAEAVIRDALGL